MYTFVIKAYKGYKFIGYVRIDADKGNAYVVHDRSRGVHIYDRDLAYKAIEFLNDACTDGTTFKLSTF